MAWLHYSIVGWRRGLAIILKRACKNPLDFLLVCGKIASLCNPNRNAFDLVVSFLKSLTYILLAAFIWWEDDTRIGAAVPGE
jgi:hypothetical protein